MHAKSLFGSLVLMATCCVACGGTTVPPVDRSESQGAAQPSTASLDPKLQAAVQNRDSRCWKIVTTDWRFALMSFEEQFGRFPVKVGELEDAGLLGYTPLDANGQVLSYAEAAAGSAISLTEIGVTLTPTSVDLWRAPMARPTSFQRENILSSIAAIQHPGQLSTATGLQIRALWLQTDYRLMTFTSLEGRLPSNRSEFETLTRSHRRDGWESYVDGVPGIRVLVNPLGPIVHVDEANGDRNVFTFEDVYKIVPGPYQYDVSKTGRAEPTPGSNAWLELASFDLTAFVAPDGKVQAMGPSITEPTTKIEANP